MSTKALKPRTYAGAMMSLDVRGRLVLDAKAVRSAGVLDRQFTAAKRLNEALLIRKKKAK